MLSSTAKNIYWMGRYLQRAKTTARLIEATQRMALQSSGKEAENVVAIFGMEDEFRASQTQSQGQGPTQVQTQRRGGKLVDLVDFLAFDETNPSSIASSISSARRNAREERNNITVDVWESLNGLWLELSAKGPGAKLHHRDIIGVALRRMNQELHSDRAPEVIGDVLREITNGHGSAEPPELPLSQPEQDGHRN